MNDGHAGSLVAPAISLTKAEAGFRVFQSITSVAGTYTGGSDRVSGEPLPLPPSVNTPH
jgi:NCS1 family nucleobase:cation symporter-1